MSRQHGGLQSPTRVAIVGRSMEVADARVSGWAITHRAVVKARERDAKLFANDPDREARLWDPTAELLRWA
jgi:hypothetical protein